MDVNRELSTLLSFLSLKCAVLVAFVFLSLSNVLFLLLLFPLLLCLDADFSRVFLFYTALFVNIAAT